MDWFDRVLKGRFRDVPFLTDATDRAGGHRVVVHQYPLRNKPYTENLGREAQTYTFDCFVVGPGYMDTRDRLITALEKDGPGTLVHPYYGALSVQVLSYRVRESSREGGKATFQIQFVEPGDNTQPDTGLGTGALVDEKADAVLIEVQDDFANRFNVGGAPQFVNDSAVTTLTDAASTINTLNGQIAAATSPINQATTAVNSFTNNLTSLVQQPANLVQDMVGLVSSIATLPSSVDAALIAYEGLFEFGDLFAAIPRTTPQRTQESDNQDAIIRAIQLAALAEAMRASALINYNSRTDAIAVIDRLVDEVDRQTQTARADGTPLADPLYNTLAELQAAMVRDINQRSASLTQLTTYSPLQTLPAVLIAYELYGDATREDEIIRRNNIIHPGFVLGGSDLEVVANG